MKWNEILIIWVMFQVGNLISWTLGANLETVFASLYFSGVFAIFLAAVDYFIGAKNARN